MLTKLECSALRAFSIMAIMIHNYCHWLPYASQENEFYFDVNNHLYFVRSIISQDFIIHLFSYLGHFGVSIFVFLSGYGLSQKYDIIDNLNSKSFIKHHYVKLLIPLTIGTVSFLIVKYIIEGSLFCSIPRLLMQCSMILNLIYPYEQHVDPGPYWYFGLTMQLYVVYIYVVYKRSLMSLFVITAISLFILLFLGRSSTITIMVWVKYNAIGWLLPFIMGVFCSRFLTEEFLLKISIQWKLLGILLLSVLILVFGYDINTWIFIPAIVVLLSIVFVKLHSVCLLMVIDKVGRISMYIFVVHSIVREFTLPIGLAGNYYIGLVTYLLITMIVSMAVDKIIPRCQKYLASIHNS